MVCFFRKWSLLDDERVFEGVPAGNPLGRVQRGHLLEQRTELLQLGEAVPVQVLVAQQFRGQVPLGLDVRQQWDFVLKQQNELRRNKGSFNYF